MLRISLQQFAQHDRLPDIILPGIVFLSAVAKYCKRRDRIKTWPTTIMRAALVVISVLTSISLQPKDAIGAQDSEFTAGTFGRELPAGAPTKYREDYLLASSSISPNKKLALIYPKEGDEFPTQPESGTADNYL